jgi:hypothetical protein
MKTRFLLFVSLIFFVIFSCQKKEDSKTTIINGLIVDSLTNMPINDVSVSLMNYKLFVSFPSIISNVHTDSLGRFLINFDFVDGGYTLSVYKIGYKELNYVDFKTGKTQNLTIKLLKQNN